MKSGDIHRDARLRFGERKLVQGDQRIAADVVGSVAVHYHSNDDISVQGNIADKDFGMQLLDHADQAISGRLQAENGIIIPARDVNIIQSPKFSTLAAGDKVQDYTLSVRDGKVWQGDQLVEQDVVYSVAVHYHASGEVSLQSTAPNNKVAKLLLETAIATVKRQQPMVVT